MKSLIQATLGAIGAIWKMQLAASLGFFLGVCLATGPALAQPYPNRPVKIIIPFPPLERFIAPEEIAALTAYLLSPDAAAITGQGIAVCGGASLPH